MRKRHLLFLLFFFIFEQMQAQTAQFTNASATAGINEAGDYYGVAISDYDNDGDDDIYLTLQGNSPNRLYRNNGDGTFTDVAADLGIADAGDGMMSLWADVDNDGDQDLYVGNKNGNDAFYLNEGGTFTNKTTEAGINNPEQPRSLNYADIDKDGDLDLYIANINAENILYRNNGDGTFTDITVAAGAGDNQISMGAVFFDYDQDNDPDLYLTHDANQAFILYENDGTGNFTNVAPQASANIAAQGMGVDIADFNLDGHLDLYITNLYENSLLLNDGDHTFTDISESAGIQDLGMGWGIICMDYNNDGYPDVYICNESPIPPMENNKLYKNNGDNTFTIVSEGTQLASPYSGFGAACADFNQDGKADIFIANKGTQGCQLFINEESNSHNWLQIRTQGTTSNRDGVGARVTVTAGGKTYTDEVTAGSGFASQNSMGLHFGLAEASNVDEIRITWPSGVVDVYNNISPNQQVTVVENQSIITPIRDLATLEVDWTFANPSVRTAHISYQAPQTDGLTLTITSLSGKICLQKELDAPYGEIIWQAPAAGTYFINMKQKNASETRTLLILD